MRKYSKEEQEVIIKILSKESGKKVDYDGASNEFIERKNAFYWEDISEIRVNEALEIAGINLEDEAENLRQQESLKQNREAVTKFLEKYSKAVTYFFNKSSFDNEGIYVMENSNKRYLTLAELDDLLAEFKKRKKIFNVFNK